MTIKTKYSINDIVFVTHQNSVYECLINRIAYYIKRDSTYFHETIEQTDYFLMYKSGKSYYHVMDNNNDHKVFKEKALFKTKALLLKSL